MNNIKELDSKENTRIYKGSRHCRACDRKPKNRLSK